MSEPWMKWSEEERQAIAEEYRHGATLRVLARKYHHDMGNLGRFLKALGISKPPVYSPHVRQCTTERMTPAIQSFAAMLVAAQKYVGHLTKDDIDCMMNALHWASKVSFSEDQEVAGE